MNKNKKLSLNEKLDKILINQDKILENESKILGEELKIEELERKEIEKEISLDKKESQALSELDQLQKNLRNSLYSPMKKITKRDMFKGFIGSFVGIMSHFAFSKGAEIAFNPAFPLSPLRATFLYLVAFVIIIVMLYYSGFKKIEKTTVLKIMPLRALVLYSVSIVTVIFVNLLFNKLHYPFTFTELYVLVGANIILAVMGAGTADLIGRVED